MSSAYPKNTDNSTHEDIPPLPDGELFWSDDELAAMGVKPAPVCDDQLPMPEEPEDKPARIVPIGLVDLLNTEFPPRENIVAPWLPAQGLVMVYAMRGIGKTFFALFVAYAIAAGQEVFGWTVPHPRSVLYIDGEMPAGVMQERLASIAASFGVEPSAEFRIITPDLQPRGMIDLSSPADQADLEQYLDGVDLIIVDNISTLCRNGAENESDSWLQVQEWALKQRAAGRTVMFIHHAGKGGQQRGTSKREDVLDTVVALRRPSNYDPARGAVFELHFEKSRGFAGEDARPFEASLITDDQGRLDWVVKGLDESTLDKVVMLAREGLKQHEIAKELDVHKSTVNRAWRKAKAQGLIDDGGRA